MEKHAKEYQDKVITIKVTESELKEIDHYAKKMRINRSQLIRNLVNTGLSDVKLMNKTGLLTMALKGFDLLDHIKESLGKDQYQVEDGKVIIDL